MSLIEREVVLPTRTIGTPLWSRIIDEFCSEHRISRHDFIRPFGPRRYAPLRILLARRLSAAGYKTIPIGHMIKRDHTTVCWYLGRCPNKRQPMRMP